MKKVILAGGPFSGAYTEVESDIFGLVIEAPDLAPKTPVELLVFGVQKTWIYKDTGRLRMCPVSEKKKDGEEPRAVFEIDFQMSRGPVQWEMIL